MLAHVDLAAKHFKEKIEVWHRQRAEVSEKFDAFGRLWDRVESEDEDDFTKIVPAGGEGG